MATSALSITPHSSTARIDGKIGAAGVCNLGPDVAIIIEGNSSSFASKRHSAEGSGSCRRTGKAGLCLFCLMLYSHHPRIGGTQICVGKCQAVTIDNTCLSPYEMTPDVLVGVETLQRA